MSALKFAGLIIVLAFLGCIVVVGYAVAIAVCGTVETCSDVWNGPRFP